MFMPVLCKSETFIVLTVKIGLMIKILRLLMITFDLGSIFVFYQFSYCRKHVSSMFHYLVQKQRFQYIFFTTCIVKSRDEVSSRLIRFINSSSIHFCCCLSDTRTLGTWSLFRTQGARQGTMDRVPAHCKTQSHTMDNSEMLVSPQCPSLGRKPVYLKEIPELQGDHEQTKQNIRG